MENILQSSITGTEGLQEPENSNTWQREKFGLLLWTVERET